MSVDSLSLLSAVDLYGAELLRAAAGQANPVSLRVFDRDGEEQPIALERYVAPSAPEERSVLERAIGPVLDVGCGPGRHVLALSRLGVAAVGLDISPLAVQLARGRGAQVIEASIFDSIPGERRWGSALLLDGNVGIGGAPEQLLSRVESLLRPGGQILVEVESPGVPTRTLKVSLESTQARSRWFPWARLSIDGLGTVATGAGLRVVEQWQAADRWFAALAL